MKLRGEMLATIQQMCRDNLVLGTWGNVSVRDGENHFLITPSGMEYSQLTAEDLVRMDFGGSADGRWKPSSEWRLHAALFQGREDIGAIVHTHSVHATAFAVARMPVPAVVEDLVQVAGGSVDVAAYTMPGTEELAQNALQALGSKSAVLLASHGLVGVARTLPEALKVCQIVEKTAQAALLARLLGPVHELSDEDISAMRSFYLTSYGPEKREEEIE
ncbi:class II aldolase/adducin family protein [Dethiobacter alkaliphilus]|uniref:Class II aldolase/adducin family protein n=1 Tax=Dethiobacter alkaliphilus AHT 1 TaxID=555088 RepID=C0GHU6_DETAL|nr:class II aldolase/adducin family protein [Dethiobacter alkaliphilus]EEG77020.1 class II aldolase/adducin family protein [Dethiobacter alkaliphilus AHT 1]